MPTTPKIRRWLAGAAFACGALAVVLALTAWRVPPGNGDLGADVFLLAAPTGELGVSPTGPFLRAEGIFPTRSDEATRGTLVVRNQTGRTLGVQLRLLPSGRDLDHLLRVTIDARGRRVYGGRLAGLRSWTPPFTLDAGRLESLRFAAWLPESVDRGFRGRVESIPVEFEVTSAREAS